MIINKIAYKIIIIHNITFINKNTPIIENTLFPKTFPNN